jgi:Protein of unknown function (DUF1071)
MSIEMLLKTNVNDHTEKKANLTYLSWSWAWAEALKADPKCTYKVELFDGKCYMDINGTYMVWVTVTMFDKPMTCQLPVMDHRNKAIPKPDSFQVNTAIMRCMTKALSLHGLGLYIYAGEDLPEGDNDADSQTHEVVPSYVNATQLAELQRLASELNIEIQAFCTAVKVDSLAHIRAADFDKAVATMERKRKPAKAPEVSQ